jgi:hypothetical protein
MEEALLKVGDPAFRKDWEEVVLKENAFEQMFSGKEVFEDVKVCSAILLALTGMVSGCRFFVHRIRIQKYSV